MKTIPHILTLGALFAVLSAGGLQAHAQTARDRLALIDSLSNPMVAKGSEVMRFDAVRIDAGEMNEDSGPSEYVFRWTNGGTSPVSVVAVNTTCRCAVPSFERRAVQPGDSGTLKVTYNPKGLPGGFSRKIMVYTNLSSDLPTAVLELSGYVHSSVLPTGDYPVAMGGLLLKRSEVAFVGDARQTERIECLNAGDKILKISVDSRTLPAGVYVEPLTIAPGETADLVLRFDPSKADAPAGSGFGQLHASARNAADGSPVSAPVFLKGIPLPPTKCMITIKFE